jgi:hypothetical protein
MGLLEWLGERENPGPTGLLHYGARARPARSRGVILVRLVLAAAALTGWLAFVIVTLAEKRFEPAAWWVGGTLAYLLAGYHIHPEPDRENLGWWGGVIDHPLRWSDDVNRLLLLASIVLWPGRFVSESLRQSLSLLRPPS